MQRIVDSCDDIKPCLGEEKVAALTTMTRPAWADARQKYFSKGENKESLDVIEKAAFFVSLDGDSDFYSKDESSQDEVNRFCKRMLNGNGYNRWFDKTMNLIVCSNGKVRAIPFLILGDYH